MVTVYVTERKIPMDAFLLQKLDLMIKRITKKNPKLDAVFENEGPEGSGKTTMSIAQGYYIHSQTGRPFSEQNVFLDTKKALKFAQDTKEQIIIFDEPALDVLSTQWWNETQQDLVMLLMLARKKRHFIIFNFTKFWKFNEYIVVDRSLGMTHLYERRDNEGYAYVYIPKAFLPSLYNDYKYKRQRNYFKYGIFTGQFPDVLNPESKYNLLDIFNIDYYDAEKDKAIKSIGKKKKNELALFKHRLANVIFPIKSQEDLAKKLKVHSSLISKWKTGQSDEEIEPIVQPIEDSMNSEQQLVKPTVG